MDKFTRAHLETFIQNHINIDHHEEFRSYAITRCNEDMDHWLTIGWSALYGKFLYDGSLNSTREMKSQDDCPIEDNDFLNDELEALQDRLDRHEHDIPLMQKAANDLIRGAVERATQAEELALLAEAALEIMHSKFSEAVKFNTAIANEQLITERDTLQAQVRGLLEALEAADEMIQVALHQFNWGASALNAEAITLLNEVPGKVKAALAKVRP